jgi:hypothetical protein
MLLPLLLLALGRPAFADCPMAWRGDIRFRIDGSPFASAASWADYSEPCRRLMMYSVVEKLEEYSEIGPCPLGRCADLGTAARSVKLLLDNYKGELCKPGGVSIEGKNPHHCELMPEAEGELVRADDLLAQVSRREVSAVEDKIRTGRVPHCLLPPRCPGTGCGAQLADMLSAEIFDKPGNGHPATPGEHWITDNGFLHLELGSAFVCSQSMQVGGTCGIYSGASLLRHYCSTPRFNPSSASACGSDGPGFHCPSTDELLKAAWLAGAWRATECSEDKASGQSRCGPAKDTGRSEAEDLLARHLGAVCPKEKADSLDCRRLREQIEAARRAAPGTRGKPTTGYWAAGTEGTRFKKLAEVYKSFGFETSEIKADEEGWERAMNRLYAGHPVQLAFDPKDWAFYWEPGSHAVIAEGAYLDADGTSFVLIKDTNKPNWVKLLPTAELQTNFVGHHGGGLTICPPSDSYCSQ